ncbi:hypothetical protein [Tenuibacillus multivorans]|uniref:Uncharacterized protein n=1 Tax=Tenuibacillus multivorans TaxID=237069 RepID=A0A1H0FJ62_9BACI|nr:hypothetical protein [Tenuibacillus multivorans]GEL77687.1 hypothetical protein TMU01_19220 [Tenuibacillus multivorans]SDN94666.1 hypothetical protein SAMN05216498_0276 [Tenuibacillus multivorans]
MQRMNIQWLPVIASIGIGAVAYSMMTGRGGQLQSFLPLITNMMGQQGTQGQQNQQQGQQDTLSQIAQQSQQQNQKDQRPSVH